MKRVRYYLSYLESFLLEDYKELDDSQLEKLDILWKEMDPTEVDFCNTLIRDYIQGYYTAEQLREIITSL